MNYGLALAGGGTRGAAHAGVLLALKEEGLLPEAIGGTSAGSIAAGCFASGMDPEELCEEVRHLAKYGMDYLDPDIVGVFQMVFQVILHRSVCLSGLLKGKRLNRYFRELTGGRELETLSFPLLIPAVDLMTGDTVCFTNIKGSVPGLYEKKDHPAAAGDSSPGELRWVHQGYLGDIMMASSSVPGIFSPMKLNGGILVDGGVSDNLPVDLLVKAGVKNVVAVDVGSDYEMPEDECIFETLSHSFSIMSGNLKNCKARGERLLLKPTLTKKAGLLTFRYMEQCMEESYVYTKRHAGKIRKMLGR